MNLWWVLVLVLLIAALGGGYQYGPGIGSVPGVIVVILIILLLMGRL